MQNPVKGHLLRRFGKRLAEVRKQRGITQSELAELVDMSVVGIAYIENGKRWASLRTLDKIAQALQVKRSDLLDF